MSGQREENPEELEGQFPEEAPDIQLEETVGEKDSRGVERLGEEIEQIEIKYSNAQNRAQKVMDSLSISKRYDKLVNKLQKGEAKLPVHQTT